MGLPLESASRPPDGERYTARRDALEHYFDRTAADKWRALTDADEAVSRIRATVRAGREEMRTLILSWLGEDGFTGQHLYDAGCGTGALAVAAADGGAAVLAVDLSPTMVGIARERTRIAVPEGTEPGPGEVDFRAGDMLGTLAAPVDLVAAMDSLIHYELGDVLAALTTLAPNVRRSIVFTFAPRTSMLAIKHAVGGLFPRHDKAPEIVPIAPRKLFAAIEAEPGLAPFKIHRTQRVHRGFYTSQAVELRRR